jgi:hypothetical protein
MMCVCVTRQDERQKFTGRDGRLLWCAQDCTGEDPEARLQ